MVDGYGLVAAAFGFAAITSWFGMWVSTKDASTDMGDYLPLVSIIAGWVAFAVIVALLFTG